MFPRYAPTNSANSGGRYTILSRCNGQRLRTGAYCKNLRCCEFGIVDRFTTQVCSMYALIRRVLLICSNTQMAWVDAGTYSAKVTNFHSSLSTLPISQGKHSLMHRKLDSMQSDPAVSVISTETMPNTFFSRLISIFRQYLCKPHESRSWTGPLSCARITVTKKSFMMHIAPSMSVNWSSAISNITFVHRMSRFSCKQLMPSVSLARFACTIGTARIAT